MRLVPKNDGLLRIFSELVQDNDFGLPMGRLTIGAPVASFIRKVDEKFDGDRNIFIAAIDEKTDMVGGFVLIEGFPEHRRCEIHHAMLPNYRGKFYLRVYDEIMKFSFEELRYENVYGFFTRSNKDKSKHLVRKGWSEVAMLPEYYVTYNGLEDAFVYRISKKDWREKCQQS